jgi:hypothetical protein
MAFREHFLARLLELPRISDREERRGIFRQTIATLGHGETTVAPMALAGVDPQGFAQSIQIASTDGLLDDLAFIRPAAAASALHQIANALPHGDERRAIGRKVLTLLYKGDAETFAVLATRMALGQTKALVGAGIRARVELCLGLRGATDAATDRLALAIAMRRELANEWISSAATGALPDRRMAGQLLERAAREAARRASQGDRHPLRIFQEIAHPGRPATPHRYGAEGVGSAWDSLLADRETLVWKHVAIARGSLSVALPEFAEQTRALLSPELTPTEWRRGATSLVARVAVDRERGLDAALTTLEGPLLRRDPGIAMAMVWGLAPVAEVEPEAAEELLDALATMLPIPIAESVVELRQQVPGIGERAALQCAAALRASLARPELDDGLAALARGVISDLELGGTKSGIGAAVQTALDAFGERGTREAYALARRALAAADVRVAELTATDVSYEAGSDAAELRQRAMLPLRELDATLLESHTLASLMLLDRAPGSDATTVDSVGDLHGRLVDWLLHPKRRDASPEQADLQATFHQRQLRTLLHLIDSGHTDFGDDPERRAKNRQRWTSVVAAFTDYVKRRPQSRLTRALLATVTRALDALVRDGSAEPVDVVLFVATHFVEPAHVGIAAEASMHPDVTQLLGAYLRFVKTELGGIQADQAHARIDAFKLFLEAFPTQTTLRTEALRRTCWTLLSALETVLTANSLRYLLPDSNGQDEGVFVTVEDATVQLHQLVLGAERRCSDVVTKNRAMFAKRHALAHAIESVVRTSNDDELYDALTATARGADAMLPGPMALLVTQVLPLVGNLQTDRSSLPSFPVSPHEAKLPDWIPARRILGGFFIVRPLGGGNVGSVFVVTRADERREKDAQRFALKVPEYNATAARTMSEAEFLKLFRDEAGALLAIPEHPNIASFVTFDAGAKPKPLLVMELVEGVSCERILASGTISTALALHVMEGMLAGLAAMHDVGIAHLDVKPSNVILRGHTGDPVLVDFGLAGRKLRPGCATLCYGAPEIWDAPPSRLEPLPASAADVYAFGACAYELLTGKTLFDGTSDIGIISQHMTHDGLPPAVAALGAEFPNVQAFLASCLRQDARARASVKTLRAALPAVRAELTKKSWPIA